MKAVRWNGKQITEPGIYVGVPIGLYHSGKLCDQPNISSTALRTIFNQSEAHYWCRSPYNLDRIDDTNDSASLILGRATHHLILGEPRFRAEFAITPSETKDAKGKMQPWSMRFDSAKEWVAARKSEGFTVITQEQAENIKGIADRLKREPLVANGVLDGLIECTLAARDPETGVWMLARPDVVPTDSADFTDLKTTPSVIYSDLVRTIGEYGYHQQGALVAEVYETLTGEPIKTFSLYFVESKPPYCARMVILRENDLALGRLQNRNAIRRFVKAMNAGRWPGPGGDQEEVQEIEISGDRRARIMAALERSQL
jgi:hypothetical protein